MSAHTSTYPSTYLSSGQIAQHPSLNTTSPAHLPATVLHKGHKALFRMALNPDGTQTPCAQLTPLTMVIHSHDEQLRSIRQKLFEKYQLDPQNIPKGVITLMGLPGSGKGTKMQTWKEHLPARSLEVITASEHVFNDPVAKPFKEQILSYTSKGLNVPFDLTKQLFDLALLPKLRTQHSWYVLDGIPREEPQISYLIEHNHKPVLGLYIDFDKKDMTPYARMILRDLHSLATTGRVTRGDCNTSEKRKMRMSVHNNNFQQMARSYDEHSIALIALSGQHIASLGIVDLLAKIQGNFDTVRADTLYGQAQGISIMRAKYDATKLVHDLAKRYETTYARDEFARTVTTYLIDLQRVDVTQAKHPVLDAVDHSPSALYHSYKRHAI
jgi:adenylate kinase family enzyme